MQIGASVFVPSSDGPESVCSVSLVQVPCRFHLMYIKCLTTTDLELFHTPLLEWLKPVSLHLGQHSFVVDCGRAEEKHFSCRGTTWDTLPVFYFWLSWVNLLRTMTAEGGNKIKKKIKNTLLEQACFGLIRKANVSSMVQSKFGATGISSIFLGLKFKDIMIHF